MEVIEVGIESLGDIAINSVIRYINESKENIADIETVVQVLDGKIDIGVMDVTHMCGSSSFYDVKTSYFDVELVRGSLLSRANHYVDPPTNRELIDLKLEGSYAAVVKVIQTKQDYFRNAVIRNTVEDFIYVFR